MELAPVKTRIFLQKGRRQNLRESLRRTRFLPLIRNFLIKKTYMRLMRLSEVNYQPKNSVSWVRKRTSDYLVPSLIMNCKERRALVLHWRRRALQIRCSPMTSHGDSSRLPIFCKPTQTRPWCPHVGILLALHWSTQVSRVLAILSWTHEKEMPLEIPSSI